MVSYGILIEVRLLCKLISLPYAGWEMSSRRLDDLLWYWCQTRSDTEVLQLLEVRAVWLLP